MEPPVSAFLSGVLPWAVIAVLLFNMSQRRFMNVGTGKRFATLQLGGLLTALWGASIVLRRFGLPDLLLLPVAVLLVTVAILRRQSIFLHRLRCASCGARLPIERILYHDAPRCAACDAAAEAPPDEHKE